MMKLKNYLLFDNTSGKDLDFLVSLEKNEGNKTFLQFAKEKATYFISKLDKEKILKENYIKIVDNTDFDNLDDFKIFKTYFEEYYKKIFKENIDNILFNYCFNYLKENYSNDEYQLYAKKVLYEISLKIDDNYLNEFSSSNELIEIIKLYIDKINARLHEKMNRSIKRLNEKKVDIEIICLCLNPNDSIAEQYLDYIANLEYLLKDEDNSLSDEEKKLINKQLTYLYFNL